MIAAALLLTVALVVAQESSFVTEYRACLKSEAVKLDDGRSDITVIYDVAIAECTALKEPLQAQILTMARKKEPSLSASQALRVTEIAADKIDQKLKPEILKEILLARKRR